MTNFHNVVFPEFLSKHASSSINFSTEIIETKSGFEIRKIERNIAKRSYIIENVICTAKEYNNFITFFQARKGRGHCFRFKDYFDYKVQNQKMYVTNVIDAIKYYSDNLFHYIRSNIFIIPETLTISHLGKNIQSHQNDDREFILDNPFEEETEISCSFQFDVIVRFASDEVKYHLDKNGSIIIEKIELLEVLV